MRTWGTLHDLTLLYVFLAHGADAELDDSERSTIREKLELWRHEAPKADLDGVVGEVLLTYMGTHSRDLLNAAMVSLKESMDLDHRIAVLNDLAAVASADGVLVPGEVAFIQELAAFWEVEDALREDDAADLSEYS